MKAMYTKRYMPESYAAWQQSLTGCFFLDFFNKTIILKIRTLGERTDMNYEYLNFRETTHQ